MRVSRSWRNVGKSRPDYFSNPSKVGQHLAAVDIHSHFLPKTWPDFAKLYGGDDWPWLRHDGHKPEGVYGYGRNCGAMLMVGDSEFRPVTAACWDVAERIRDLDSMGIGRQVISQTPLLFQWHRDPTVAAEVARIFNDLAIEMVRSEEAAGRLEVLCQVPLQNVGFACDEVTRCKKTGHIGVQIGNHLGARDLDDDELVGFLKHCADEGVPVLVHPWEMSGVSPGNRTGDFMMGWTVGMPMETHLSITRMILGGAFDRLPENLRICFAHGGGAFPALLGRMDNAWRERSLARGKAQRPPREYMGRFAVDSAVFDPAVLNLLIDVVGPDNVMLGSDYPFPLGEQKVGNLVRTAPGLTDGHRKDILWRNAESFWGLPPQQVEEQVKEVETSIPETSQTEKPFEPRLQRRWVAESPISPTHSGHLLVPALRWIASPPILR